MAIKAGKSFAIYLLVLIISASSVFASDCTVRETYLGGRRYMQEGHWTIALKKFHAVEKDYVILNDYVLFDMAACYEKSGEKDKAVEALKRIINGRKDSPLYRKAFRGIIEITKEDIKESLRYYDLYTSEFPQDAKALWEKAELLKKAGATEKAFSIWEEVFFSGNSCVLKAYEMLKANAAQPSREEIKKAAYRLLEKGNYRQALSLLESLTPEEEEEKYLLGRAHFYLRHYHDAIRVLKGVSFGDGRYLYALSLIRTNEKQVFYSFTEGLVKQEQEGLFNLLRLAAELKRREGNAAEAAALLQSMKELYPEKEEEVSWLRAWMAIRQGRLGDAEKLLFSLTGFNSCKKDKYFFWLGKIQEYQGRKGDHYYSQIKDQKGYYYKIRAENKENIAATVKRDNETQTGKLPLAAEEMETSFLRIAELENLKMRAEAVQEARLFVGFVTTPYVPSLARLLIEMGEYSSLIRLGIKHDLPAFKYPLAYRGEVFKHAGTHGIDPFLVIALMREESRFKSDAVSVAGALGVMQIMPATARRMAHIRNNEELFDVEKNIGLGVNHLSGLIAHFKRLPYAVAAYNAGERNVEKWLAAGYRDEDEFTEDIPFSETKSYVFRVMETYGIMTALYAAGN